MPMPSLDDRSTAAELSTLRSQLDEMIHRVTVVADRYGDTPDSAIAADLYAAERSLVTARRAIERARAALSQF